MTTPLPPRPSPEFLRKQAKHLLQKHKARDTSVCVILRHLPRFARMSDPDILASKTGLQEVQHALAHEYGSISWMELISSVIRQKEAAMNVPRNELKTMNDLIRLDDRSIQMILRQTQPMVLTLSLLRQGTEVRERIFRIMSKEAAAMFEADMVRMKGTPEEIITEAVGNMLYTARWVMEKELDGSAGSMNPPGRVEHWRNTVAALGTFGARAYL